LDPFQLSDYPALDTKQVAATGAFLRRWFAFYIPKLHRNLPFWLGAIWILFGTIAFVAQNMGKPSSSTIFGEDDLVYVPTKSRDMRIFGHYVIVFRQSPNIEFLENVSTVELHKTTLIELGKAYRRYHFRSEHNRYDLVAWNLCVGESGRQLKIAKVPINIAPHIFGLSVTSVFPLRDNIECRVVSLFNQNVSQEDVCPQLPLFSVVRSNPLIASVVGSEPCEDGRANGCEKREDRENGRNIVMPVAMLFGGLSLSGVGFWQLLSPKGGKFGYWLVEFVASFAAGWLLITCGMWLGLTVGPFAFALRSLRC
jgi:hypothetical protein